jgi:putative heme-binding domain-containing protein
LNQLNWAPLDEAARLAVVRAYQLTLIRLGLPEGEAWNATLSRLDALYPSPSRPLNRELAGALIRLKAPGVVAKTVPLMLTANDADLKYASDALLARNSGYAGPFAQASASRPNQEQIAFAYLLREATVGWTPALRKSFFSWFPRTAPWQGGNSFRGFLENIRKDALATIPDVNERQAMEALSTTKAAPGASPEFAAPKGPGQSYTVDQALAVLAGGVHGRSYDNGLALFHSTGCASCHRFNGSGGGVGPDLTGVAGRFSPHDLLESVIEPSKEISDQYGQVVITKKDGDTVIGRVANLNGDSIAMMTDMFDPNGFNNVKRQDIVSIEKSKVSPMPEGLLNTLTQDEVLDLLAYLLSRGQGATAKR